MPAPLRARSPVHWGLGCIVAVIILAFWGLGIIKATEIVSPPSTPTPSNADCQAGRICIRWFVGLGTGTELSQVFVEEEVVKNFNAAQDKIQLILEVYSYNYSDDALSTEIASGNGPDIIGPVGWAGANDFDGQWLDLSPYIQLQHFDTSVFDPALLNSFRRTEEGLVGLPSAIYPAGLFFVPSMFDESGLAYPPQHYGEKYRMPDGTLVEWNWETLETIARLLTIDRNGKNSTEAGFDRTQIAQVGYAPQWQDPAAWGLYDGGPSQLYTGEKRGDYRAAIPDSWKRAWQRHYQAIWGEQPWMIKGALAVTPEFGNGNVFNSARAAMTLAPTWYTCCLSNFATGVNEFQLGIIPLSADGAAPRQVDADTFRIWKGTRHPDEAFQVLAYLITTGSNKLLPIYGALPAISSKTNVFFQKNRQRYLFVTQTSWDVFKAGVAYPDRPSTEGDMPNFDQATSRLRAFGARLDNTPPDQLDFEAEFQKLEDDLTVIFNR